MRRLLFSTFCSGIAHTPFFVVGGTVELSSDIAKTMSSPQKKLDRWTGHVVMTVDETKFYSEQLAREEK